VDASKPRALRRFANPEKPAPVSSSPGPSPTARRISRLTKKDDITVEFREKLGQASFVLSPSRTFHMKRRGLIAAR
jgi:hypothetical protein